MLCMIFIHVNVQNEYLMRPKEYDDNNYKTFHQPNILKIYPVAYKCCIIQKIRGSFAKSVWLLRCLIKTKMF